MSAQESKKRNVKAVPAFLTAQQGGCLWARSVQQGEDGSRSTETSENIFVILKYFYLSNNIQIFRVRVDACHDEAIYEVHHNIISTCPTCLIDI